VVPSGGNLSAVEYPCDAGRDRWPKFTRIATERTLRGDQEEPTFGRLSKPALGTGNPLLALTIGRRLVCAAGIPRDDQAGSDAWIGSLKIARLSSARPCRVDIGAITRLEMPQPWIIWHPVAIDHAVSARGKDCNGTAGWWARKLVVLSARKCFDIAEGQHVYWWAWRWV